MYKFSKRSYDNLVECHPDLQLIANTLIRYIDFAVIEGHRDEAQQNHYYWRGTSKVRYPNSKHNSVPSMAMDIIPVRRWTVHRVEGNRAVHPADWSRACGGAYAS